MEQAGDGLEAGDCLLPAVLPSDVSLAQVAKMAQVQPKSLLEMVNEQKILYRLQEICFTGNQEESLTRIVVPSRPPAKKLRLGTVRVVRLRSWFCFYFWSLWYIECIWLHMGCLFSAWLETGKLRKNPSGKVGRHLRICTMYRMFYLNSSRRVEEAANWL